MSTGSFVSNSDASSSTSVMSHWPQPNQEMWVIRSQVKRWLERPQKVCWSRWCVPQSPERLRSFAASLQPNQEADFSAVEDIPPCPQWLQICHIMRVQERLLSCERANKQTSWPLWVVVEDDDTSHLLQQTDKPIWTSLAALWRGFNGSVKNY